MRPTLALAVVTAALAAAATPAQAAVAPADLEPHLRAFADIAAANGGTRAAGLPGYDRSADYVAGRLQAAGWQVTRRPASFPFFEERSKPVLDDAVPGRDVVTVRNSGAGDVRGRTRAILSGRCTRRGFRAIRRGEIAIIPFAGCSYRQAALVAQREGAAAVLFDDGPDTYPLAGTIDGAGVRIPALIARTTTALRALRARRVRVRVDAAVTERRADSVLAELPGPSSRVVMAGGHLDSVPEGPGMNDNASGAALLLELAERLPAASGRRATLRLAFWTAEEYGLYGSRQYVRELPSAERRRIGAYLNFDMIGSPDAAPEIYDADRRIERALRRALPRAPIIPQGASSDHAPFQRAGIPAGGLYTGGLEEGPKRRFRDHCYHRRCDAAGNVDLGVLSRMAGAAERAMAELAR